MEGLMILLSTIALILIVIYDYQVKELYRKYRETNRDLRFENEEQKIMLDKIKRFSLGKNEGSIHIRFNKIKELFTDANQVK